MTEEATGPAAVCTAPQSSAASGFAAELSALRDGELSSEREALVREHLLSCPACRGALAALGDVDAALHTLATPRVADDLAERLQARIAAAPLAPAPERDAPQRTRAVRRGRGVRFGVAAGLAAAAVLVLAVVVVQRGATPIAPGRDGIQQSQQPGQNGGNGGISGSSGSSGNSGSKESLAVEPADEDLLLALEFDTVENLELLERLEVLEQMVFLERERRAL